MKLLVLFAASLLVTGCSIFTKPPREDAVAIQEQGRALSERAAWSNSRSRSLEKSGLSRAEAKAVADIESALRAK